MEGRWQRKQPGLLAQRFEKNYYTTLFSASPCPCPSQREAGRNGMQLAQEANGEVPILGLLCSQFPIEVQREKSY